MADGGKGSSLLEAKDWVRRPIVRPFMALRISWVNDTPPMKTSGSAETTRGVSVDEVVFKLGLMAEMGRFRAGGVVRTKSELERFIGRLAGVGGNTLMSEYGEV